MSPSPYSRPNVLKQIPEIGLEGSNLLFFRPNFHNVQWPFNAFPGVFFLRPVARKWCMKSVMDDL